MRKRITLRPSSPPPPPLASSDCSPRSSFPFQSHNSTDDVQTAGLSRCYCCCRCCDHRSLACLSLSHSGSRSGSQHVSRLGRREERLSARSTPDLSLPPAPDLINETWLRVTECIEREQAALLWLVLSSAHQIVHRVPPLLPLSSTSSSSSSLLMMHGSLVRKERSSSASGNYRRQATQKKIVFRPPASVQCKCEQENAARRMRARAQGVQAAKGEKEERAGLGQRTGKRQQQQRRRRQWRRQRRDTGTHTRGHREEERKGNGEGE